MKTAAAILLGIALVVIVVSQPAPVSKVGPLPGGGFLLNSGWKILPAGKQTPVDTFPMSSAISKDGRHLLVLNGGYNPPSISVLDVASGSEISRTRVADGWLGLALSPDGRKVCRGAAS